MEADQETPIDGSKRVTIREEDLHLGAHEGTGPDFLDVEAAAPTPAGPLDGIRDGLKLWADVGLTLGRKLDAHTEATNKLLRRLEANTPVNYGPNASGAFPAAGNLVLSFGTPDQGTYWEVESVVVGGTDVNVAAAGSAGLYVSGFLPPSGQLQTPGMTSLVDRATALPNAAFYGGRDITVNDQEYLFLILFGGSAGQTYVANAQVTVLTTASGAGRVEVVS